MGDWGLGIGDCPQPTIPNHKPPNPNPQYKFLKIIIKNNKKKIKYN